MPSSSPTTTGLMVLVVVLVLAMANSLAEAQCTVATNVTAAKWHSASTWTGCTGTGGLPGASDSPTISVEGNVITIDANTAAINVESIVVANYARLINHGDVTAWSLVVTDGGEVDSDGALTLTISGQSNTASLTVNTGHMQHKGDLLVGTTDTASNYSISAYVTVSDGSLAIGGSLSVLSTELGSAQLTGGSAYVKTGSTLSVIGGIGATLSVGEYDIEVVSGNLAVGTMDAATYSNNTGSVTVSFSTGNLVLQNGNLIVESGAAKGDGSSGPVTVTTEAVNVAVAGAVIIESGDVNTQNAENGPGNVELQTLSGTWVVTAVANVEGSGSMLLQGGNGGQSLSGYGTNGASVGWVVSLMHVAIAGDLMITGGQGGYGNLSGGASESVGLNYEGINTVVVGRDLLITNGNAGNSTFGSGGPSYGAFLYTSGGTLTVGRDLVLTDGRGGDGVTGGYAYSGVLELSSSTVVVGRDFKQMAQQAGNSVGGGYGGSCESPDKKKKRGKGSVPVFVTGSNLQVGGNVNCTMCSAGNGLGGNGGYGWSNAYFTIASGSTVGVAGSFLWTGGSGGNAVNTSTFSSPSYLSAGQASSMYVEIVNGAVTHIAGDLRLATMTGGSVTGASGSSGSAGYAYVGPQESAVLSVAGDIVLSGAKAGDVLASSVANSTGAPGSACFLGIFCGYASELTVGGNVWAGGCDWGRTLTNVYQSIDKRELPAVANLVKLRSKGSKRSLKPRQFDENPAGAILVAFVSSKITVAGTVTLVGGMGGDATANDAMYGGTVELVAEVECSIHLGSSASLTGGRGGNSDQSYGGSAGAALAGAYEASQLRTGDLTLMGGSSSGQGFNSSWDGRLGFVMFEIEAESQYMQYGAFKAVEGQARNVNVSTSDYTSESIVLVSQTSQWTIYPCATGGAMFTAANTSQFHIEHASTFRDCRGLTATVNSKPSADVSSDVSCFACTCTADALLFDECGSGASLRSAAVQVFTLVSAHLADLAALLW